MYIYLFILVGVLYSCFIFVFMFPTMFTTGGLSGLGPMSSEDIRANALKSGWVDLHEGAHCTIGKLDYEFVVVSHDCTTEYTVSFLADSTIWY